MFAKRRIKKAQKKAENERLITLLSPESLNSEQFRTIRTNIQYGDYDGQKIKTLVVTSAGPGEGKSTSAANLAIVFADSNKKILLIDADLRKPTVFKSFGMENNRGLSLALVSDVELQTLIQPTPIANLDVFPSGAKPPNPSELLGSSKMQKVIEELKQMYDYIIFDVPPVAPVTDAKILAAQVDATIIVIRENQTKKQSITQVVQELNHVGANLIGVIYNGAKQLKDHGYYS